MVEFDLEKKVKEGMNFHAVFRSLILYSISLFIAFWWSDFTKEIMTKILPVGQNLIFKGMIGILMTIGLVIFVWIIVVGIDRNAERNIPTQKVDT